MYENHLDDIIIGRYGEKMQIVNEFQRKFAGFIPSTSHHLYMRVFVQYI